jgi:signal peptidase I
MTESENKVENSVTQSFKQAESSLMVDTVKPAPEGFWPTARLIGLAVLVAYLLRSLLFEPFTIPSASMEPTLQIGDYVVVSKFDYGLSRYSFPLLTLPINGRLMGNGPARGDIVVFKKPGLKNIDYIKRVIGLPGDEIQVTEGRLYINRQLVPRAANGELVDFTRGEETRRHRYTETLPGGVKHTIVEFSDSFPMVDDTRAFVVPDGHYFMMGDNRDDSNDSRSFQDVGYVPVENIIGKAIFVGISFSQRNAHAEKADLFESLIAIIPGGVRTERFFKSVYSNE